MQAFGAYAEEAEGQELDSGLVEDIVNIILGDCRGCNLHSESSRGWPLLVVQKEGGAAFQHISSNIYAELRASHINYWRLSQIQIKIELGLDTKCPRLPR